MIKIFYGNDRVKIAAEVKKLLGDSYEVFDGENLQIDDIVNIFKGTSLLAEKRNILLKDLTEKRKGAEEDENVAAGSSAETIANNGLAAGKSSSDFYEEISKYADTEHNIVIWETTLSQKKSFKDFVKDNKIEVKKIDAPKATDMGRVFGIFDLALRDGEQAVKQLEEIEKDQDPYMFFGLLVSQALKRYDWRSGQKEKRILKELAKVDLQLKSTTVKPWILIKSLLVRMPKI